MRLVMLAETIASTVDALKRCRETGNKEWETKHEAHLDYVAKQFLPSGGGIDNGTTIDIERSTYEKIVLHTSYHHMTEGGFYDGWTDHVVTIRPTFGGISVTIGGRNRNDIKDYLADTFHACLSEERENVAWHDPKTLVK